MQHGCGSNRNGLSAHFPTKKSTDLSDSNGVTRPLVGLTHCMNLAFLDMRGPATATYQDVSRLTDNQLK